ncbi:MAG: hypothetical protein ACLQUY_07955 [Ktedonobacterales bacterium]
MISLELEDASPTSAALLAVQCWVEKIAERETARIIAKCERYTSQGKPIPRWVRQGMDEGFRRVQQIEHRVQMLLGIFRVYGVLPLEYKPAYTVVDLVTQYLDKLELETAERIAVLEAATTGSMSALDAAQLNVQRAGHDLTLLEGLRMAGNIPQARDRWVEMTGDELEDDEREEVVVNGASPLPLARRQ